MQRRRSVIGPLAGTVGVLPGSPDFALLYESAIPQKDQLCGAFWRSLILSAAGHGASQEEVALRAGTTLAEGDPARWLPGASPRADYEATIPVAIDKAFAGTSATGVARGIEELSGGVLTVVPVAGPWNADAVVTLVEIAAATAPECVLIANLRTGRLWGSRPPARLLLDYLLGRQVEAPPPDWDCGHFLTIAACMGGPGGALRDRAERGRADLVTRERVQQPCGSHYAGQGAAEGADRGADGDELADPSRDELAAEVAEQRARIDELLDALCVGSEAHHLDGSDENVVQTAEDGDAEDRARYVAAGLLRLLAQRRGGLKPGEGEES